METKIDRIKLFTDIIEANRRQIVKYHQYLSDLTILTKERKLTKQELADIYHNRQKAKCDIKLLNASTKELEKKLKRLKKVV